MDSESEKDERHVSRRTFLGYVFGAIAGFMTAVLAVPLAGMAILPALRQSAASWVSAGTVDGFAIGEPKAAQVTVVRQDGWIEIQEPQGIWVIRNSESDFTVFNGRCVHLGCAYSWNEDQQHFICPCHGGVYGPDGQVRAGPPPRPLDTLEWRVENGALMVAYTDFRLGVSAKEAI